MTDKFVITRAVELAIQSIFHGAKHRAKGNGAYNSHGEKTGRRRKFNITQAHLLSLLKQQNGLCALSGIPLTFVTRKTIEEANAVGNPEDFASTNVSIDRINPNFGYVYGNVQLVTSYANKAKGEMMTAEFLNFCMSVVKFNHNL